MVHARMLKPVALTRDTLAAHVETAAGAVAYGKDPAPGKHVEDADGKFKFMDICKSAKCGLTWCIGGSLKLWRAPTVSHLNPNNWDTQESGYDSQWLIISSSS